MCNWAIFSLPFTFVADNIILKTVLICINSEISLNKNFQMILFWILFLYTVFFPSSCCLYTYILTRPFCGIKEISLWSLTVSGRQQAGEAKGEWESQSQDTLFSCDSDSSEMLAQLILYTLAWPPESSGPHASQVISSSDVVTKVRPAPYSVKQLLQVLILASTVSSQTTRVLSTPQAKGVGASRIWSHSSSEHRSCEC